MFILWESLGVNFVMPSVHGLVSDKNSELADWVICNELKVRTSVGRHVTEAVVVFSCSGCNSQAIKHVRGFALR